MTIECLGHAKFLLTLENGMKIVTDPFDVSTGYPIGDRSVDVCLVSHSHHDHSAVETLTSCGQVIDTAGHHTLAMDVTVDSIPSWHDEVQGTKRGPNLISLIQAEGLRVVHLGDLGHLLSEEQVQAIGRVDVLMIPVGGFFTIDADTARKVCNQLKPAVILPMHYRTQYNEGWPIAPVDDFLAKFEEKAETLPLLRVTAGDLCCQPRLAVLEAHA